MSEVIDVTKTANRYNHIRAERKGLLALVLHKTPRPIKCLDGCRRSYQIEEIVLSEEENELACVKCNEFNYYTRAEVLSVIQGRKNLFDLIPMF